MNNRGLLSIVYVIIVMLCISTFSGCSKNSKSSSDIGVPPITNNISSHSDIILPSELKWDSSESMAIKTDSFNGGIYHYSGRLDLNSLKDFIISSMAQNRWKLVGEAVYESTMLAFIKPNKTCMITLSEGIGGFLSDTHVELYVTHDLAAAKGLNPFGEPVN